MSLKEQNFFNIKDLKEYHCQICDKLLCKGILNDKKDVLQVKCRGCHHICFFYGKDADIIKQRSILIKNGGISDPEKD